jgi:hypothetical protein
MLQKLDGEIRECYRHAAECSRSADQNCDLFKKQDFLDMEERWLCLARSYEFAERLSNFTEPVRGRKRQKTGKPASFGGSLFSIRPAVNETELVNPRPAEKE